MSHRYNFYPCSIRLVVLLVGIYCVTNPTSLSALEQDKILNEWYRHYYQHQDTRLVVPAINYFLSDKYPAGELSKMSLLGFFSSLFTQYPQQAVGWVKQSRLTAQGHKTLLYALARAGLNKQARMLAEKVHWPTAEIRQLDEQALLIRKMISSITSISELGLAWGTYQASGNKHYLDIIIESLLQAIDPKNQADDEGLITTMVQTLRLHRSTDDTIAAYYQNRYDHLSPEIRTTLVILFAASDEGQADWDCE